VKGTLMSPYPEVNPLLPPEPSCTALGALSAGIGNS
jgi:hypothetical protein